MKLAVFYNWTPDTIGNYFLKALVESGHTARQFNLDDAGRLQEPYDVYLRIDHGDYTSDMAQSLRPAAFYVVDAHLEKSWRRIRQQAARYDLVFCAQRRAAELLRRAHWVPMGCDPDLHGRQPVRQPLYDIAFVGNDGGVPRKFYLEELRQRFPRSFIGRAPHTRMAEIYSQAKIVFHYIECTSSLKDMISMRVFEAMAAGTLLMANALEHEAFESIGLRDLRELVIYRSPRELFRLLDYYLAHEAERRAIAEAGQRVVLAAHTYRHRVERMVGLIESHLLGMAAQRLGAAWS